MSLENVEVVRAIYESYERGDFLAAFEGFSEDIEWFGPPDVSNSGFAQGHEGVRQSLITWVGTWDETVRTGKAVRQQMFRDRAQALEAVGH